MYPRKGEIWAIHKKCDSTEDDLDIVEVVESYRSKKENIKVMALTPKGFTSVYTRKHGSDAGCLEIPKAEMRRFSHQIPAFKQEAFQNTHIFQVTNSAKMETKG